MTRKKVYTCSVQFQIFLIWSWLILGMQNLAYWEWTVNLASFKPLKDLLGSLYAIVPFQLSNWSRATQWGGVTVEMRMVQLWSPGPDRAPLALHLHAGEQTLWVKPALPALSVVPGKHIQEAKSICPAKQSCPASWFWLPYLSTTSSSQPLGHIRVAPPSAIWSEP
jgi:hypothetical protein